MKLILATNAPNKFGLAYFYYLAFKKLLNENDLFYLFSKHSHASPTLSNRITNRFRSLIQTEGNTDLSNDIKNILNHSNGIVNIIFFNSAGLNKSQFSEIADYPNVKLINYLSDSPSGMSDDKFKFTLDSLPFMQIVFVYSKALIPVVYQFGAKKVIHLPFAYCLENHFVEFDFKNFNFDNAVYYFGTWGPFIEEWLYELKDFNLHIQGNSWSKSKYKELRDAADKVPALQDKMAIKASKAGVVVNFIRAEHGCFSSMKTFELAAAGACIVTNRTQEQVEFFGENDFKYFDNKKEMVDSVQHLLNNSSSNLEFRINSSYRVKNHSYDQRANELLLLVKE